jgi:hypothetical protein
MGGEVRSRPSRHLDAHHGLVLHKIYCLTHLKGMQERGTEAWLRAHHGKVPCAMLAISRTGNMIQRIFTGADFTANGLRATP